MITITNENKFFVKIFVLFFKERKIKKIISTCHLIKNQYTIQIFLKYSNSMFEKKKKKEHLMNNFYYLLLNNYPCFSHFQPTFWPSTSDVVDVFQLSSEYYHIAKTITKKNHLKIISYKDIQLKLETWYTFFMVWYFFNSW